MYPRLSELNTLKSCSLLSFGSIACLILLAALVPHEGSAAQVLLSWEDNSSNETGFKIERATGTGSFVQIAVTGSNIESYTDTNAATNTSYQYRVRSYNSAGHSSYSNIATVSVATSSVAANTAPTVGAISNVAISEDGTTGAIGVTVGDAETSAGSLQLTATSSNTTLVPNSNITFGGSGSSRTITVKPAANQSGSANITAIVSDGSLSTSTTFTIAVTAVNDAPTISNIADRTINAGASTGAIGFTLGDIETAATSLTLTSSSSNPTLVAASGIVFGGSGTNRTATVTPVAGKSGNATITVIVSDGSMSASDTFVLTVTATSANTAPTISSLANTAINEDTSTGAIAFTVGDAQTAASNLTVTSSSSNLTLVPTNKINFGGSGANRTVTITPAADQSGSATITVMVSDGTLITTKSFVLTVTAVNDAPTIASIANQSIQRGGTAGPIGFAIGDAETAAGSLTLRGSSSNLTLVPGAGITFGGSGANRTVTVTPVATQTGSATITVQVSDGTTSSSRVFTLTVTSANQVLTSSDIGAPTLAGSMSSTNGTIQIRAAGTDIWGSTDHFHFARQQLQGDAEMTVHVASLQNTNVWTKAGLMFRGSLEANASHVSVFVTPSNGVVLQWRTATGGSSQTSLGLAGTAPEWLRLMRSGDTLYAFRSADGLNWELVEFVQVDLPDLTYAGLAVTSHNAQSLTTAVFDSFAVD